MEGNHVVLDISSDEDVGFNWAGTDDFGKDIDWRELYVSLESEAGNNQNCDKGYDSDEPIVVGEVLAKPKRAKKSSGVAKLAAQYEEDDDCVVLDRDPDKPAVEDDDSGGESDDLVIVAEKGQVACRDYPHPRHLCVKFPFDSTLHSDHCSLCHCYVCDSPAPCGNWGSGHLEIDHCHATEKEELWKDNRKRAKETKSTADTSFWKDLLAHIPETALPLAQNSGSQSHFPGEAPSFDPPNIIRSQRTAAHFGRNRYSSNQPSRQPINPCSNNVQRARISSLGPHPVTSSPNFKRPRTFGRTSVAGVRLNSRQARGNSSFDHFRHDYSNNLVGVHLASKQADTRQLHMGYLHGAVNSNPHQNSSAGDASQISTSPVPSQSQVQLCTQSTAWSIFSHGNQSGNISGPMSSNAHYDVSQSSQCFTGASHPQGEQYPLTEEQLWHGDTTDFQNLELDNQFLDEQPLLNEMSVLDPEGGIHADYLWSIL